MNDGSGVAIGITIIAFVFSLFWFVIGFGLGWWLG